MAKKEYSYRGKSLEELQQLGVKEFAQLVPARERRSLLREFTEAEKKLYEKIKEGKKLKTHCRTLIILPEMVGKTVHIHRGNAFEPLIITEDMIGHRLGEFSLTRKRTKHSAPGVGATKGSKVKARK